MKHFRLITPSLLIGTSVLIHFSNNTAAKGWCEDTQCPTDCSSANQENCCLHHVNVHSCPEDEVRFGLCPPWLPSDGEFYTHSQVTCGSSLKVNWTAEVSKFYCIDLLIRVLSSQKLIIRDVNVQ